MDFYRYRDDIRAQLQSVTTLHIADSLRSRAICESLLVTGKELNDNALMGFAYYYLAESYFVKNEYPPFVSNLLLGLKYQLQPPEPFLLTRSYNMLGIHNSYTGDISMAMDHYLNSLQYAEQSGDPYMSAVAYFNIGSIYRDLADIDAAILSFKKALSSFDVSPPTEDRQRNLSMTCSALAVCYLEEGDAASALKYFEQQNEKRDKMHSDARIAALSFEVKYYHTVGDHVRRNAAIEAMLAEVENVPSLLGVFDELFSLCGFLHKMGYFDQLWRLLCGIDDLVAQTGITDLMLKFMTYKAYYYAGMGRQEEYLAVCAEHFTLSKRLEKENQVSLKNSIKLREDLEKIKTEQRQMQTENMLLLDKSRRDFLTNLPNREWLNEHAENAFNRAFQNGTRLAIEILDIDEFKQYNDTLGHMAGDRYLQALSKLLHTLIDRGLFCARHGGDEFVIIYEDRSDSAVMEIAETFRQDVMALSLAERDGEPYPPITVSQGICSSIPMPWVRLWDYFHAADQALYYAKNTGRNAIRLTSFVSETSGKPMDGPG
ncbi:MAG TPA: diguanylate cyclase [Clostridia bacterium]|nr:diguanylate cyclase [Clostridia bacterium]